MAYNLSPIQATFAAVALLIAGWSLISTIRLFNRLKHIKGPPLAGLSEWWLARSVGGGRTHLDLYEVCEKYGMFPNMSNEQRPTGPF